MRLCFAVKGGVPSRSGETLRMDDSRTPRGAPRLLVHLDTVGYVEGSAQMPAFVANGCCARRRRDESAATALSRHRASRGSAVQEARSSSAAVVSRSHSLTTLNAHLVRRSARAAPSAPVPRESRLVGSGQTMLGSRPERYSERRAALRARWRSVWLDQRTSSPSRIVKTWKNWLWTSASLPFTRPPSSTAVTT